MQVACFVQVVALFFQAAFSPASAALHTLFYTIEALHITDCGIRMHKGLWKPFNIRDGGTGGEGCVQLNESMRAPCLTVPSSLYPSSSFFFFLLWCMHSLGSCPYWLQHTLIPEGCSSQTCLASADAI